MQSPVTWQNRVNRNDWKDDKKDGNCCKAISLPWKDFARSENFLHMTVVGIEDKYNTQDFINMNLILKTSLDCVASIVSSLFHQAWWRLSSSVYFPSLKLTNGSSYFIWTDHVPSPFHPISRWCHINILPLQNSWDLFSSLGWGCKQFRLYINTHCNEQKFSWAMQMQNSIGYEIPKTLKTLWKLWELAISLDFLPVQDGLNPLFIFKLVT